MNKIARVFAIFLLLGSVLPLSLAFPGRALALSDAAEITSYTIPGEIASATIDTVAATVGVTMPFGTDVTNLVATYTISANATAAVGGVPQQSGMTSNNFTSPVVYAVTAENTSVTRNWRVSVTVAPASTDAALSSLTVSAGALTPTFAPGTVSYTDNVDNTVASVTVTPTVNETHASVKVNSVVVASGSASAGINLNVGSNTITIVVTAQDGITTKTYSIGVTRAPSNAAEIVSYSIGPNAGTIDGGAGTITVTMPFGTSRTNLVATFMPSTGASVKIGGVTQASGVTANDFSNAVTYVVIAQDGTTTKDWTVTVAVAPASTDAALSGLSISAGSLTPTFASGTLNYTDNVSNSVTSVTVTPTVSEGHATVIVNSAPVTSGSASAQIPLNVGVNTIAIVVTAQNGATNTYTIIVMRMASGAADIVTYSVAGQAGSIGSGTIEVVVPFGTSVTNLVATFTTSDNFSSITVGTTSQVSAVTANDFTNPVTYVVTSQDGTTTKTWVVTVIVASASGDATLKSLGISAGVLTPGFAPENTSYTDHVANSVNSVVVTPVVNQSLATVKVNGMVVSSGSASGPIYLSVGANTITIVVTAQSGGANRTYTITVTRDGPVVSGGGGLGGAGGYVPPPAAPGTTNLAPYTNGDGVFNLAAEAYSFDRKAKLVIGRGVLGRAADGSGLMAVSIVPAIAPASPPPDSRILGSVYELGPTGTSFRPAASLVINYDVGTVSASAGGSVLFIAYWDPAAGKWVQLQTTVDAGTLTASAPVDHFSTFALFASLPPAKSSSDESPEVRAPSFSIGSLAVTPDQVEPGKTVTVSASVTNRGDLSGTYEVSLKVNGTVESTQTVKLDAGASQPVTFQMSRQSPGTFSLDLNGLPGAFVVRPALKPASIMMKSLTVSPAEPYLGDTVVVTAVAENTGDVAGDYRVTFKIGGHAVKWQDVEIGAHSTEAVTYDRVMSQPGVLDIEANGLTAQVTTRAVARMPGVPAVDWRLIGVVTFAVVAVGAAVALGFRRGRA